MRIVGAFLAATVLVGGTLVDDWRVELLTRAVAEDDDEPSIEHLVAGATTDLATARGWAARADDPDLNSEARRDARRRALDFAVRARDKLQRAVDRDPARQRELDARLVEAMRTISNMRKSSGLIDAGPSGNEGPAARDAPDPRPDDVPTSTPRTRSGGTDPSAPPDAAAVSVISWDEWDRTYREICAGTLTTAGKIDALRAAASARQVEFRAKVLDIEPARGTGDGALLLRLCGIYGGQVSRTFVVQSGDRDVALGWGRWDRISWRETIDVRSLSDVVYRPVYRGLSDLARSPNPGITYPKEVRELRSRASWMTLLRQAADATLTRKWLRAFEQYDSAAAHEYAIPGRVISLSESMAEVQPEGDLAFTTRDRSRRFGPEVGTVQLRIDDPQVHAALVVGSPVTLALAVRVPASPRALRDSDGRVEFAWRFHKLRTPATTPK